ncbi:hypothetical protein GCK72_013152 [Caenorhabditis remanei]|uniref:Uncharacterized protein n=1 Tax=Caenorhabditis remanei TaxID=31234 RepID=A0A6A5GMU1_CAERE|nr:hypothetical protein GCK72_013152 [Caenorhabditis remanei]KAF1756698.1 hypothetical protein GCK72_013152 [Caenorhabditis remanei]
MGRQQYDSPLQLDREVVATSYNCILNEHRGRSKSRRKELNFNAFPCVACRAAYHVASLTSSWKGKMTETVGNFAEYIIFLQSLCRISLIDRFNEIISETNLWDLVETGIIGDGGEGDNSLVLVSGLLDDASNLSDGEWLTVTARHAESLQDDGVELLSGASSEESVELKIEKNFVHVLLIKNSLSVFASLLVLQITTLMMFAVKNRPELFLKPSPTHDAHNVLDVKNNKRDDEK